MVVPSEPEEAASVAPPAADQRWRRSRPELLAELAFGPLASSLVRILLPLRVPPPLVVLANGVAGVVGAYLVARGQLVGAALFLQLKTVLDNADGRLARRSGRTSALGRYLDTEVDLVVNGALIVALGYVTGAWTLALVSLVALTLVLSADFNEDVLRRRVHGEIVVTEPSPASEGALARLLAGVYHVVFAPQDRAFQRLARKRLERLLARVDDPALRRDGAFAYHDGFTSAVLANFGLSTQLAVLGVCLVLSVPVVYLWLVLGCAAALPLLELRRGLRVRRAIGYYY